jgi:4-amino-4-deoxy-L-arabinose transferase-like glycosyltransferase
LVVLAILAIAGIVLRAIVAGQSLFADELSTYWISATHGFSGVVSLMYGTPHIAHPEITPPLYFLAAWLTSQFGHSPEWLRAPALIAGAVTIPLVYVLGARTVGRRAASLATAVTALSPFMIYYSAEARAYGLMMALLLGSTIAMLLAIETRRTRWWILYAVCSCAAFYTHYTCAFVLAVQFAWLVWAHPDARRAALIANVAAAAAVLPWLPGLLNDFRSPTLKILSALSPFTAHEIRLDLEHWAVGYPYTLAGGLRALPGTPALFMIGIAAFIGVTGCLVRVRGRRLAELDRRVVLVVALALSVPVGEAIVSLGGNHIFGVRNLAASWPFLTLACASVVAAGPRWAALSASFLAVVGFGIGAAKMLSGRFDRPDYQASADYVAANARPGDVVLDETGSLSPGPLTGLDVALNRPLPVVRAEAPAERGHPYDFGDRIVPLQQAIRTAVARAGGHRVFLVTNTYRTEETPLAARLNAVNGRFPSPYRLVAQRSWPGIGGTQVRVYSPSP